MTVSHIAVAAAGALAGYLLGKRHERRATRESFLPAPLVMGGLGAVIAYVLAVVMLVPGGAPEWDDSVVKAASLTEVEQLINETDKPVLVDFYADWCPPCRRMAPHVNAIAREGNAMVVTVDVDEQGVTASEYDVQVLPTILVFHEGELRARQVGYQGLDELRRLIEQAAEEHEEAA